MAAGLKASTTRSSCHAAGAFAVMAGVLAIVGWAFELPRLTDWVGSKISMFANTALSAILSGTSLILICRGKPHLLPLARVLAGFVFVVGAVTLIQLVFQVNFGIDTLLIYKP